MTAAAGTEPDTDLIQPFQVEAIGLRGRLVRLGPAIDEILGRHAYPVPVSFLLGEVVALAATFASAVKFDGIFSLELRGAGPVRALVADIESPGTMRGYARFDAAAIAAAAGKAGSERLAVADLIGNGFLCWTVDPLLGERHQGIVALEGDTIATCAESYFRQSEQLRALVHIGVGRELGRGGQWHWCAGAIMVQAIAAAGGRPAGAVDRETADEHWRHARALAATLTPRELVDPLLPPTYLLYRLYHEVGVAVHPIVPLVAGCRCSDERVRTVLRSFSPTDVADMVVGGRIEVTCEFCNKLYLLDPGEFAPAH